MARERITITDVARVAAVSKSTVSLVLRDSAVISPTTVRRVRAAIDQLGYVYNRGAASMRHNNSRILGVVIHDLSNSVFSEIAVGVDLVSHDRGYVQFIADSGDTVGRQSNVITSMQEHGIAGLIVSPAAGTRPGHFDFLTDFGIPVVQVGRSVLDGDLASVVSANRSGAASAVTYLHSIGHRRIGFIGGIADTQTFASRLEGYTGALDSFGLDHDSRLVVNSVPSRVGGSEAYERSEQLQTGVTALLCFNDAVALGVIDAVRRSGRTPGRDVSIIGFDDIPEARFSYPALTTVSVDPRELGRESAQLLLALIETGHVDQLQVVCPVHLIVRDSCSPVDP